MTLFASTFIPEDSAAMPCSRSPSTRLPPNRPASPSLRQLRRVTPSQFMSRCITFLGSIFEQEFGCVQQGPQQHFGRLSAVRAGRKDLAADGLLFGIRSAGIHPQVEFFDDLIGRHLARRYS